LKEARIETIISGLENWREKSSVAPLAVRNLLMRNLRELNGNHMY